MSFDEIIVNYLGGFGKYQKWQYLLVGMPTIFIALHSLSWTFTGAKPKFRCLYPGENGTTPYLVNDTWHEHVSNITGSKDTCKRVSHLSLNQSIPPGPYSFEPCLDGYAWDHSDMVYSATGRWSLVCDRDILRAVIQCMYHVGQFFGSIIFGILSDKIGRKPMFLLAIALQIVCGTAMALVPHWNIFALLLIGVGFSHPGIFVMAVVIAAELVAPKYRPMSSVGAGFFFVIGELILGVLAYPLRDYRYLQLAISLPALLFLSYWWLVPESPRWLMSRGRFQDADRILQRVAKFNGKDPLPSGWYKRLEAEHVKRSSTGTEGIFALFRTPNLRRRTLITFLIWLVVTMCFYGLTMNPAFLGGNNKLGFIIGSVLEIPARIFVLFGVNRIGRKFLVSGGFLLATTSLLLTLTVPKNASIVSMILVVIGKSGLTVVTATVYIMTPEHYPTIIRSTAVGACSMIARAGGVAASFMALYLAEQEPVAVVITFAVLTTVAGILAIFLPETTGEPLMESIEEAEAFGVGQPIFISGNMNRRIVNERMQEVKTHNIY